jgi:arsenate reductase (glutaredoxin)
MDAKTNTTLKIYHNPRCKKSREGLAYLQSKTNEFQIVEYLKSGLTRDIIKEILLKSSLKSIELVRIQEDIYKKQLKGMKFNDEEWINILIENPVLLQRPIVVGKHKAVFAQPVEEIDKFFLCV